LLVVISAVLSGVVCCGPAIVGLGREHVWRQELGGLGILHEWAREAGASTRLIGGEDGILELLLDGAERPVVVEFGPDEGLPGCGVLCDQADPDELVFPEPLPFGGLLGFFL
jgi:hypothetical protein